MVEKIRTDVSFLSGVTGAIVTPRKHIPKKKKYIKSLEMSQPRKSPILTC